MSVAISQSRRFIGVVALGLACYFGILLGYGLVFDPWQVFHRPWLHQPLFINNARFQNAGLINSYDFHSVILGSSMAENFSAEQASRLFGSKFINLSMAGSFFSERAIILDRLFAKQRIDQIIISLDHLPLIRRDQFSADLAPENYRFLYNGNRIDDFRIYLDWRLLRCWNFSTGCEQELPGGRKATLHGVYEWQTNPAFAHGFEGVASWCRLAQALPAYKTFLNELIRIGATPTIAKQPPPASADSAKMRQNLTDTFEAYVLPHVRNNPSTRFIFFLPPYSRVWHAMGIRAYPDNFWSYIDYVRYLVRELEPYDNARIYGFDELNFPAEISNYKDQSHYSAAISSRLLAWMADGEHELRQDNVEAYLSKYIELSADYDLAGLGREIGQCLNPPGK